MEKSKYMNIIKDIKLVIIGIGIVYIILFINTLCNKHIQKENFNKVKRFLEYLEIEYYVEDNEILYLLDRVEVSIKQNNKVSILSYTYKDKAFSLDSVVGLYKDKSKLLMYLIEFPAYFQGRIDESINSGKSGIEKEKFEYFQ